MKVVAYSIKSFEKEPLAIANHKKHEITLISNALNAETVSYAAGKEAIIVFEDDDVSESVIHKLADLGVKYIATRSTSVAQINQQAAAARNIKIANVPLGVLNGIKDRNMAMKLAEETILNLDKWQHKTCLGMACACAKSCNKTPQNPVEPNNSLYNDHKQVS